MTNGQNNLKKYPYKDLGNQLKDLRGSLDKKDFAERLGVGVRTYYRYENGERKVPAGLFKLAHMLIKQEFQEEVKATDTLEIKITGPDGQAKEHSVIDSQGETIIQRPGDPVIQAITRMEHVLKIIGDQKKDIDYLKDMCEKIEERLKSLEQQLQDATHRPADAIQNKAT